ncbi:hypothetical protein HanRHA438_Chr04g0153391 [Helianthus annuus]|nr:hypothetical protein HanIR_Chr04g0153641 [Helianthus annuus]KAJ0924878.1 hypothetical protein HanRHA438_Chr04g0153391 [Helianthus annuus]
MKGHYRHSYLINHFSSPDLKFTLPLSLLIKIMLQSAKPYFPLNFDLYFPPN